MAIQRIKKVNVGEQVFEQLKQMLLSGEWAPGDKLPSENELAVMFGVSRITVRQALQKLNALDLLETKLGEGSFVKKATLGDTMQALIPTVYLSEDSISQVMEFRSIIEIESTRLAARRATEDDIKQLLQIHQNMMKLNEKKDLSGFAQMDAEFHFEIGKITKNSLLVRTNQILREVLQSAMDEIIELMGCESALKYHALIIDALSQKNENNAVCLMREHLDKNYDYLGIPRPSSQI